MTLDNEFLTTDPYSLENISYDDQAGTARITSTVPYALYDSVIDRIEQGDVPEGAMLRTSIQLAKISPQLDGYVVKDSSHQVVDVVMADTPSSQSGPLFDALGANVTLSVMREIEVPSRYALEVEALALDHGVHQSDVVTYGMELYSRLRPHMESQHAISARMGTVLVRLVL